MVIQSDIENKILSLIESNDKEGEEGKRYFANGMAKIIYDAIVSATILVPTTESIKMNAGGYPVIMSSPLVSTIN